MLCEVCNFEELGLSVSFDYSATPLANASANFIHKDADDVLDAVIDFQTHITDNQNTTY